MLIILSVSFSGLGVLLKRINNSSFGSIAINGNGNIYVSGNIYTSDTYDFGNGVTVSGPYSGGYNAVLVKYGSGSGTNNAPVIETTSAVLDYDFCGAVVVDNNLKVTDADSTSIQSANITLSDANSFESLEFTGQNDIKGDYDIVTGKLMLTGSASVANYQTALRSVEYKNDRSLTKETTVSFVANDGDSNSNIATRKINVEQRDCIDDDSSSSSTTSQIRILSAIGAGLALMF